MIFNSGYGWRLKAKCKLPLITTNIFIKLHFKLSIIVLSISSFGKIAVMVYITNHQKIIFRHGNNCENAIPKVNYKWVLQFWWWMSFVIIPIIFNGHFDYPQEVSIGAFVLTEKWQSFLDFEVWNIAFLPHHDRIRQGLGIGQYLLNWKKNMLATIWMEWTFGFWSNSQPKLLPGSRNMVRLEGSTSTKFMVLMTKVSFGWL